NIQALPAVVFGETSTGDRRDPFLDDEVTRELHDWVCNCRNPARCSIVVYSGSQVRDVLADGRSVRPGRSGSLRRDEDEAAQIAPGIEGAIGFSCGALGSNSHAS